VIAISITGYGGAAPAALNEISRPDQERGRLI